MKLPQMPQKGSSVEQTVRDIINFLRENTLVSVVGGNLRGTGNGKTLTIPSSANSAPSSAPSGAFCTLRTVASGDATNGDIYLQGGNVGGGTGNVAVPEFLLYDASSDSWAGTAGQHLVLTITGDGVATSGILDPQFNITAAAADVAASVGANTLPSSGSLSGKICRISLGTFIAAGFTTSASGDVNVTFCWGGYTPTRV